ncbi:MAG: DUF1330 domain-containing protein [Bacteroidota bacterium]
MDTKAHLSVNEDQIKAFAALPDNEPVIMLNLVKYKDIVEETGLTGEQAYQQYMEKASPFFIKANAEILFFGRPISMLIGPVHEEMWDDVLVVKYNKPMDFLAMVQAEGYPAHLRAQALKDSRLIHCKSLM